LQQEKISSIRQTPSDDNEKQSVTLADVCQLLPILDMTWSNQTSTDRPIRTTKLCKISSQPSTSTGTQPLIISHSLSINDSLSWDLFVHGHKVDGKSTKVLSSILSTLSCSGFRDLMDIIQSSTECPGNPDPHFVTMTESRKGKLFSPYGEIKPQ